MKVAAIIAAESGSVSDLFQVVFYGEGGPQAAFFVSLVDVIGRSGN